MKDWKKILILWVVPLILYAGTLPFMPLMEPDEGRYSGIPAEMIATGDYVTPHLKEVVYFEKPPLMYWATALSFHLFGKNEFASRLPVALCAWGLILLAWRMGLYFHDRRTGLYAAAVLTTCAFHAVIGRINILDMPLAFFVCTAIWAGYRFFAGGEHRRGWLYLFFFLSGLAFMTKGLIGIVFPAGVVGLWLVLSRRWRDILRFLSPVGIAIFLLVTLPWLLLVQERNPDFFRFFFIQEHFLRYTTKFHQRSEPFWFFLPVLVGGIIPWLGFLPSAAGGFRRKWAESFGADEKRFLLSWFGLILVFFSISSSKLVPYVAPLFPPLAVFLGRLFLVSEEETVAGGWRVRGPVILQSVLLGAALFVPVFLPEHGMPPGEWMLWIAPPLVLVILLAILPDRLRRPDGSGRFLGIYLVSALFFLSLIFPAGRFLTPYKSALPVVQAMPQHLPAGQKLYQYRINLYGIDFYTGVRTPVVDEVGELFYGALQIPEDERQKWFIMFFEFYRYYRQGHEIYLVTAGKENVDHIRKEVPAMQVLWTNGNYVMIRLPKPDRPEAPPDPGY
ncbi:MAG: glycosyltransferase family 39 protein [Syntrophaceae bacterium]|nr:glycosyltransferase family 39 protein [Syntrophaceae bacterium]